MLAIGISQAQAFLDGNQRAAYGAADVFLRINGMAFTGEPLAIAAHLEASGRDARGRAEDDFAEWLRGQVGPVVPPSSPLEPSTPVIQLPP